MAQRVGRGIALLFQEHGTRRGWVVCSTPRLYLTPGKDLVPILQEDGWATGPVWKDGKSRPTGIRSPDRPARSSVAILTELPGPYNFTCTGGKHKWKEVNEKECVFGTTPNNTWIGNNRACFHHSKRFSVDIIRESFEELGDNQFHAVSNWIFLSLSPNSNFKTHCAYCHYICRIYGPKISVNPLALQMDI